MGLSDYSNMEKEITNAPELKVLEKGREVKARIVSVKTGTSEKTTMTFELPPIETADAALNAFVDDMSFAEIVCFTLSIQAVSRT